jgi:uncharacterized membrane protein YjdF
MLYLTVFGSVSAFGCYMLLIGRIGAEYAAYVWDTQSDMALALLGAILSLIVLSKIHDR